MIMFWVELAQVQEKVQSQDKELTKANKVGLYNYILINQ